MTSALSAGDLFPPVCGAYADGSFFATESCLGRTLVVILADASTAEVQLDWAGKFAALQDAFDAAGARWVMLLSMDARSMSAHLGGRTPRVVIAQPGADLEGLAGASADPQVVVIDRAGRVVEVITDVPAQTAASRAIACASQVKAPAPVRRTATAPLLVCPNLLSRELCRRLIETFEAGDHCEGAMASVDADGRPVAKVEETKKRRRDLILEQGHPLQVEVIEALSGRLVPEIRRAFNVDVAHADRMLIARYDDTGGYFDRHRDNAAPHVAFRQFAVSMNLNSEDYEGGELEFPEFDNDRYAPPTGSAAVFSASLLHAALPVTRGRRYVLLTFLHDQSAEARRLAGLEAAA